MSPRISQGCALVLLLAMTLAMAAGLMAWGPITFTVVDHRLADQRSWLGIPSIFSVLSCVPLLVVSAWGARAAWLAAWPRSIRRPWLAFFGLAGVLAIVAGAYQVQPDDTNRALTHGVAAAAFVMLGLAFLAERIDALFGSIPAILGGLAVGACAALWWLAGERAGGQGDQTGPRLLE